MTIQINTTPETKDVETTSVNHVSKNETKPVVKHTPFNDGIIRGIREGKSFDLFRSVYQSKKNQKYYYAYSIFLILPGNIKSFKEVRLLPNIGYVERDNQIQRTNSNSSSFAMINWFYDTGSGLKLKAIILRNDKNEIIYDKKGDVCLSYKAIAADESGIEVECDIVPATLGDEQFLRAAFAGFGKCRNFVYSDIDDIPGLNIAFSRMLMPGEIPDVDVEAE